MPLVSIQTPHPAIVTGASRGIGRAIALAIAGLGCPVAVNYVRDAEAAAEVAGRIVQAGGQAIAVKADLTNLADLESLVDQSRREFGKIGILVNNAGAGTPPRNLRQHHRRFRHYVRGEYTLSLRLNAARPA